MAEMIKMVVVLTVLSLLSGGVLASLRDSTREKIEIQELEMVKAPAVRQVLEGASNDPVKDRVKIDDQGTEKTIFVGAFDGQANTVAFETEGNGFADKLGLIVAFNTTDDKLVGIGVTNLRDTPGLGGNAKADPKFAAQFRGLPIDKPIKVTQDGGGINALSGATITSRGVCAATNKAIEEYKKLKPQLTELLKKVGK